MQRKGPLTVGRWVPLTLTLDITKPSLFVHSPSVQTLIVTIRPKISGRHEPSGLVSFIEKLITTQYAHWHGSRQINAKP